MRSKRGCDANEAVSRDTYVFVMRADDSGHLVGASRLADGHAEPADAVLYLRWSEGAVGEEQEARAVAVREERLPVGQIEAMRLGALTDVVRGRAFGQRQRDEEAAFG